MAEPTKRRRAPVVFASLAIVAAGVAAYLYLSRRGKEKTDDAQVEAHVANVSARTAGQVKRVVVSDNQEVKPGDVLVELERSARLFASGAVPQAEVDARVAADQQADAQLAQAQAHLASALAGRASSSGTIDTARGHLLAASTIDEQVESARAQVALGE